MRRARIIGVCLLIALPLAAAVAEPPSQAVVPAGTVGVKPAAATAEAASAHDAAKAAALARAAATEAAAKAKAAAAEAKAAAAGATDPAAQAKAAVPASVKAPAVLKAAPAAAVSPAPAPAPAAAVAAAAPAAAGEPADPDVPSVDPTVTVDDGDPELVVAPAIKPGSNQDKRPARKLFGAAKAPAALAARAIGGYAKGCLAGGRALAIDGPAWQAMRLSRNRNWGHPKLVALLERFAGEMKDKDNWPGLLIGDIAQPRGGPMLTGHKSHQVGLDADIWFKPMPANRMNAAERETAEPLLLAKDKGTEVIAANWNEGFVRLVKRAAEYPEVERIFVHPAIKKAFCAAAGTDRTWLRKVRPMWLHNYHFHVRIRCPDGSPTCVAQKAVEVEGDGCGREVEDWIKLVSRPDKSQPQPKPPVVPVKPSKPPSPLMLKDLPPECTAVIAAADPKPSPATPPVAGTPAAPNAKAAQKQ